MKRKFSTYLTLRFLVFVGLPLLMVVGSFYIALSQSITNEHLNRFQALQVEKNHRLMRRFNEVKTMMQRLSDNNAIKINIMLGMNSKVENIITSEYFSSNGAFYFIYKASDPNFIPELPEDLRRLRPEIYKHCTNDKNELILKNYDTHSLLLMSLLYTAYKILSINILDGMKISLTP